MDDQKPYELPKANEKLAMKFIFDSLRDESAAAVEMPPPPIPEGLDAMPPPEAVEALEAEPSELLSEADPHPRSRRAYRGRALHPALLGERVSQCSPDQVAHRTTGVFTPRCRGTAPYPAPAA